VATVAGGLGVIVALTALNPPGWMWISSGSQDLGPLVDPVYLEQAGFPDCCPGCPCLSTLSRCSMRAGRRRPGCRLCWQSGCHTLRKLAKRP